MTGYFAPSEANGQGYFSAGKQSFRTKQHPKAKGLDLQIDFPSGWLMEEGKRPNVVVIATSAAGKGLESCTIVSAIWNKMPSRRVIVSAKRK